MTVAASTFAEVVDAVREQTALLLGTTIPYDEDDWAAPTLLPGWTRSHVAAHLVEGAQMMTSLLASDGLAGRLSRRERQLRLERRALQAGLQLQIELDEASARLQGALADLHDDTRPIPVSHRWTIPAHDIPLLRLRELVLHHYDLTREPPEGLTTVVAIDLLRLERDRPRTDGLPPVLLVSDEGYSTRIGASDTDVSTVIGPVHDLFLWLGRGVIAPSLSGASDLPVPSSY